MPRLQSVTTEEIETACDVLSIHGSDAFELAEKISKGYVGHVENIDQRIRSLLSVIHAASKLAQTLALHAEMQKGKQELEALRASA